MKKTLFFFFISSLFSFSKIFINDEIKINGAKEEIFAIGENLFLNGNLKNEFFGLVKNIKGNFQIEGDFLCASLNQEIESIIEGDFYSIGNKVYFKGKVGNSFTCLARNLFIENSKINGNLRVVANKIDLKNVNVLGKSFFYGEEVKISGVFSDVIIHGKRIKIEEGSKILGNLTYYSSSPIFYKEVEIKGKIQQKKPYGEKFFEKLLILKKFRFFYSIFSLLLPHILLLIFAPNLFQSTVNTSGKKFIKSFFLGLLFILLISLLIFFLLIIVIGVPVGVIILSLFLSALYVSRGFIFIYLARKIFFKFKDSKLIWIISIILGILIFNLFALNPILKILFNFTAVSNGFGALVIDRVKLLKKLREEKFF
ncbi:MAG: hypothetical protein NC926_02230 [Candidatus Omnitrophica bacterium]|nr:hypothetical protein [Candidatus Omnitrophota bacterium]